MMSIFNYILDIAGFLIGITFSNVCDEFIYSDRRMNFKTHGESAHRG